MHMTQPAVSLAIKELEQYYKVQLFDRIGRRLRLTQAGQQFLQYAVHISSLFDSMDQELRNWDACGILRVGASITIGSQLLPGYVKAFCKCFPGIEVRAMVEPSRLLETKLLENELDFALVEGVPQVAELIAEPYMEDSLCVICPADGRYRQGQTISLEEFKKQKFLLRESGSGTREVFDRVAESAGFSVFPIWEAMSTTALINAVVNGLGIAVLPYRMVEDVIERELVTMVRVEGLDFHRSFYVVYHKDKYLTEAARNFIALCRRQKNEYALPGNAAQQAE